MLASCCHRTVVADFRIAGTVGLWVRLGEARHSGLDFVAVVVVSFVAVEKGVRRSLVAEEVRRSLLDAVVGEVGSVVAAEVREAVRSDCKRQLADCMVLARLGW